MPLQLEPQPSGAELPEHTPASVLPPPTQWPSLEQVPPLAQGADPEQSAVQVPPKQ